MSSVGCSHPAMRLAAFPRRFMTRMGFRPFGKTVGRAEKDQWPHSRVTRQCYGTAPESSFIQIIQLTSLANGTVTQPRHSCEEFLFYLASGRKETKERRGRVFRFRK